MAGQLPIVLEKCMVIREIAQAVSEIAMMFASFEEKVVLFYWKNILRSCEKFIQFY